MGHAAFGTSGFCATSHEANSGSAGETVVVEPMSPGQWKVCNPRLAGSDPRHLLGFIEVTKSLEFEVMSLVQGFEWFTYSTLAQASEHFVHTIPEGGQMTRESSVFFDAVTTPMDE